MLDFGAGANRFGSDSKFQGWDFDSSFDLVRSLITMLCSNHSKLKKAYSGQLVILIVSLRVLDGLFELFI